MTFRVSFIVFAVIMFASIHVRSDEQVQLPAVDTEPAQQCSHWLNHSIGRLHSSKQINLCELTAGKPVLMINTASHCGFTKQFSGLETLYQQYKDKGLVVIGFPSNSFKQESKDAAETASVCYQNYGVTFAMTEEVPVKGDAAHPIFKHLASETSQPGWNFTKYLVNAEGAVVAKFDSNVTPTSEQLTSQIDSLL